nr:YgiT-type zinc finger protein [Anaerolineaceae bacterium]
YSNATCRECQVGHYHLKAVSYFTWMGDEMVVIPDFPAWVCDVCGTRIYDDHALTQLNFLLNPSAGKPISQSRSWPVAGTPPDSDFPDALEHKPTRGLG